MKQSAPSSSSHEEQVIPASSLQWGSMDGAGARKGALEAGPGTFRLGGQILPPLHVASGAPLKTYHAADLGGTSLEVFFGRGGGQSPCQGGTAGRANSPHRLSSHLHPHTINMPKTAYLTCPLTRPPAVWLSAALYRACRAWRHFQSSLLLMGS